MRIEPLEPRRLLAAGVLDPTFGVGGRVQVENPGDVTSVNDTVFLPDGKVLVGGNALFALLAAQDQYMLQRFNADGTLDDTFGDGGVALGNFTSHPGDDSSIQSIAVADDGKIYATASAGEDIIESYLARFNSDGSLDTTFGGGDGTVLIPRLSFLAQSSSDLTFQPDGKLLAIDRGQHLTRYLADGAVDTSFGGGDGTVDGLLRLNSVIEFQGNKILIGGTERIDADDRTHFGLIRLNPDGSRDSTFGTDGKVVTSLPGAGAPFTAFSEISTITFLPDGSGRFLAGAQVGPNDRNAGGMAVMRYDADGTLDTTYGDAGIATVPFGASVSVAALNLDADGNAVLSGMTQHGVAAARLTPDGQLDPTFGRFITLSRERADGATLDSAGRLLIVGYQHETRIGLRDVETTVLLRVITDPDDTTPSPVTLDSGSDVLSVTGTAGDDFIQVREIADVLYAGLDGVGRAFDTADVARVDATAGAGNDGVDLVNLHTVRAHVRGGEGSDKIAGGSKNDTLEGNPGRDYIDGGLGADRIVGGAGNDQIRGQGGADHLHGRRGTDYIQGNGGNDRLFGDDGSDTLSGGAGDDLFFTIDSAVDHLFGDGGRDTASADEDDILVSTTRVAG